MLRARVRDQRLVAGIGSSAHENCLCMGSPAGRSIARVHNDFPLVSRLQQGARPYPAYDEVPPSKQFAAANRCKRRIQLDLVVIEIG